MSGSRSWKIRAPKGQVRPEVVLIDKKSVDAEAISKDAYIYKGGKLGKRGDKGLVALGDGVSVGLHSKRGPRVVFGYAEAADGSVYPVVTMLPVIAPAFVLGLIVVGALLWPSTASSDHPLITGGTLPVEITKVTAPEEVGSIVIPGYNPFDVKEGTRIELVNPRENADYLLKYTLLVDGNVVHETPYWIEPGKADLWSAYPDLAAYSGQTVDLAIAISTCNAETQAACNGARQTVRVTVS